MIIAFDHYVFAVPIQAGHITGIAIFKNLPFIHHRIYLFYEIEWLGVPAKTFVKDGDMAADLNSQVSLTCSQTLFQSFSDCFFSMHI